MLPLVLSKPVRRQYYRTVKALLPIAYWPLWEGSGSTAFDYSGNGRDLTITGWDLGQPGPGTGRTSVQSDGTSDNGRLVGSALTSFASVFSFTTGTFIARFKMSGPSVYTDAANRFVLQLFTDNNNYVRAIKPSTNNVFQLGCSFGGVVKLISISTTSVAWVHVALTWDKNADQLIGYLNGAPTGTPQTGLGTPAGTLTNVTVGAANSTPTSVHSGWLADIAVCNRVLSADTIASVAGVR